ncbi:hypothetical protein KR026_004591 [Drosophila bipectinata]|nr:hypothetical protein KR026_004591 [Drosophila bipectinata]
MCKRQHVVKDCKPFNHATVKTQMEFVRKHRSCFACLDTGHMARFCQSSRVCNVYRCQRKHHYFLHDEAGNPRRSQQSDGGHRRDLRASQRRDLHEVISQRKRMPQPTNPTVRNTSISHATRLRSAGFLKNESQSV